MSPPFHPQSGKSSTKKDAGSPNHRNVPRASKLLLTIASTAYNFHQGIIPTALPGAMTTTAVATTTKMRLALGRPEQTTIITREDPLAGIGSFAHKTGLPMMKDSTGDYVVMGEDNTSKTKSRTLSYANSVPEDFGASDGTTISNIDTIFDEIDKALGVDKPPDIETILTDHLAYVKNRISKFLHLRLMRYGHLAIRYTTSDGVSRVMNILGDFSQPDASMVNFVSPKDYFYGTRGRKTYNNQCGVYNRPYIGVRVENVAKGATDAMHSYFQALQKASEVVGANRYHYSYTSDLSHSNHTISGEAAEHTMPILLDPPGSSNRGAVRFQLVEVKLSKLARAVPAPLDKYFYWIADFFRSADDQRKTIANNDIHSKNNTTTSSLSSSSKRLLSSSSMKLNQVREALYNSGNCAQWASGGLDFVGLIRRPRLFPKAVLIELFEDEILNNERPGNVNLVYYNEIPHAAKASELEGYQFIRSAFVHPLRPVRNIYYSDMTKFASAIVTVPEGSTRATVKKTEPKCLPSRWLQYVTAAATYLPAAIMVGLIKHVGPIGPFGAAIWLWANWWLH